jgi:hypothetical protein
MSGKHRAGQQFIQQKLWVESHPLKEKPEGYTCYARICGQVQKIRVMGHIPNMGRGNVYLDRFPLDNSPMYSSYVEYASIEAIGETLEEVQGETTRRQEATRSEGPAEPQAEQPSDQQPSDEPAESLLTVIHRYEPDAALHWLEFEGKPDAETRSRLKAEKWRFIRGAMQWRKAGLLTTIPDLPGYRVEEGGQVDYAEERAEHYEARAEKAAGRAATARRAADRIADMIPMGQPILVGHHSERRHRRDLDRIHNNMRKTIEEGKKAERLQDRAEASLAQRDRKHSPGAIARRLEGLRKDYKLYQDATEPEGVRCRDLLTAEIERLEAELEALGGLAIDQVQPQKGDLIVMHGHIIECLRVNKVNVTGYLVNPVHNLFSKESGYTRRTERNKCSYHRSTFSRRIYTAQEWTAIKEGRTQAEAYTIAEARLKEIRQQASQQEEGEE